MKVLFSFTGNRDPFGDTGTEYGPVLSLLQERKFQKVYLFCTGPEYFERAKTVEKTASEDLDGGGFNFIDLSIESVIDYDEIFKALRSTVEQILGQIGHLKPEISVLLDPGTPQMQTCWFLLVKSGCLNAALLQGIPARFAGGAYKVREVRLDSAVLPEVKLAEKGKAAPKNTNWFRSETREKIIGESMAFAASLDLALKASAYDISVLIRGETGSGKGVVARRIHDNSGRRERPFMPINCASITATLAESELFGHAKGAFTGADRERLGLFRTAEGGTVFLDEVGDLPMEIQPKLLRVLEDHTVIPIGTDTEFPVNVRVIAATNRDLEALIDDGTFRRDLYERLAEFTIGIPPLRERPEDIPLLIREYVDRWNARYREEKGIGEEAVRLMMEYPWPGNVRELSNAVTTLCAAGQSSSIGPELLPQTILSHFSRKRLSGGFEPSIPDRGVNLKAILFQTEKEFFEEALRKAGGNGEQAARLLGMNGHAFRKAMKERFGMAREEEAAT